MTSKNLSQFPLMRVAGSVVAGTHYQSVAEDTPPLFEVSAVNRRTVQIEDGKAAQRTKSHSSTVTVKLCTCASPGTGRKTISGQIHP
jgi:hypothetical protein